MANFKLTLMYDGTNYHGWQWQENAVAVENVVKTAVEKTVGEEVTINGCGRTDGGVHAQMYVCNFYSNSTIPQEKMPIAINTKLPLDIRITDCKIVDDSFNARFCALYKTYRYSIFNSKIDSPFFNRFAWHYRGQLDLEKMREAAQLIKGKRDFKTFMATGSTKIDTVRTVTEIEIKQNGEIIEIEVSADGFLYNMVRIIAGTLLHVGCGKIKVADIPDIIEKKDRKRAGVTAPPQGLALINVVYGE